MEFWCLTVRFWYFVDDYISSKEWSLPVFLRSCSSHSSEFLHASITLTIHYCFWHLMPLSQFMMIPYLKQNLFYVELHHWSCKFFTMIPYLNQNFVLDRTLHRIWLLISVIYDRVEPLGEIFFDRNHLRKLETEKERGEQRWLQEVASARKFASPALHLQTMM